jgi:hypothetical protein
MKKQTLEDLITQAEAARLRGVTIAAIGDLMKRGRLSVVEVAGIKLLKRSDIIGFKNIVAGRPKKSESLNAEKKNATALKPNQNTSKKLSSSKKSDKQTRKI